MRLKKIKQFETPEGYRQSQITEFFKNSTSLVSRKLFVEDNSSKMRREKYTDNNSESDFEATPIRKMTLPYPIISDSDNEERSISDKSKKRRSRKKTKVTFERQSIENGVMIALNKPSNSKKREEKTSTPPSSPLKRNINNNPSVSVNEGMFYSKTVNESNSAGSKTSESSDFEKSNGTPSKKVRIDMEVEGNCRVNFQIVGSDNTIPSTPSSSRTQAKISHRPSPVSTPKTTRKIKMSPSQTKIMKGSPEVPKSRAASSSIIKTKPEDEEKQLNYKPMELLRELFKATSEDKDKRKLLNNTDIDIIEEFLKMDINEQYFLMKLFTYQNKWHNLGKFCSKIKLDEKMTSKEIYTMYDYHKKNNNFLYTDFTHLTIDELLDMLSHPDLLKMSKEFKLDTKKKSMKAKLIFNLKQNSRRQSTLTMKKSSVDILRESAYKYLGYCIKLKEDVKSSFYKAYVLQTYSNLSYYTDIPNYLKDMGHLKVLYPNYTVENFIPFKTKEQFLRFFEAVSMKMELDNAVDTKNNVTIKNLCDQAFEKLQAIDDDAKWKRHLPGYLRKFSAEYLYISILRNGISNFKRAFLDDVKLWLEFLIKHYQMDHAMGFWYKQLAHIMVQHYKDYESAAQIIINAFQFNKKEDMFDFLQIFELNKLAHKILTSKTYKVPNLYCDQLAVLIESPVDTNIFPKKFIKGCTDRSGKRGKRIYSYRDANNEMICGSVEAIALKHYADDEGFEGIHCEGQFIVILFTLLFWDIIYEYYVPMTFISKLQNAPLDMYNSSFYKSRKGEIESRLEEISSGWTAEKIEKVLKENWQNHSHEKSITDFDNLNKGLDEILKMFRCIDRRVLSKILGRLAINYKRFRSGLPDLFLWNYRESTCKFVEVKGENDTLQPNQILWIQHLLESGANVQVCHVSGVGAKEKKKPAEKSNNLEETTEEADE